MAVDMTARALLPFNLLVMPHIFRHPSQRSLGGLDRVKLPAFIVAYLNYVMDPIQATRPAGTRRWYLPIPVLPFE